MASQDIRHWNHDFFCEFLDLYRGFPCLWQIKSKDYSDKNKKVQAYDVLIKKCKEVDPQANKDFVTKKINSFRTVYRKECAKIKASMRSGASTDEVHKPSLWYFDLLSFLSDADQEPRKSFSNLEDFDNEVQDDDLTQLDDVQGGAAALSAPPTPQDGTTDSATSTSFTSSTCRPGWKRKKKQSQTREILDLAGEKLKAMNNEDEFQVFGKYVAHKLRAFKGNQQIFAKQLINDVIYEGELESLTKDFKVMNCAASVTGNQFARPPNYNYNEYDIPHFGMLGFQQPCPPQAKSVQPIHVTESNKNNSESQSVVSTYFSNFTMN